jgi:hypothetical protein
MAGEQSGEPGEAYYRSGIHIPMSRWYLKRPNASASSHSNIARSYSDYDAANEFGSYGREPGANQFASESQAKAHCPGDTVVWVNLSSKIYHYSGHKDYGTTKRGAYMCERDTAASGVRPAKNEKHP